MARNYRRYRYIEDGIYTPHECGETYCVGVRATVTFEIEKHRDHERAGFRNYGDACHRGLVVRRTGKPILNHLKHKRK